MPVDQAWQVLQDVERIAPCMPGATLDTVDGDAFTGRVKVKVGPIMLTYSGKATFAEKDEAATRCASRRAARRPGAAAPPRRRCRRPCRPTGTRRRSCSTTDLAVTGKPAQFGRGVMADVSGKLIDQFAACLAEEVRSGSGAAGPGGGPGRPSATPRPRRPRSDGPAVSSAGATPAAPAAPPLPPSGAPQQAAPAPATPLPATGLAGAGVSGNGSARAARAPLGSSSGSAPRPAASRPRPQQAEAIDLLGTAGMPVAKRLAPVVAGVVVALVLVRVLRRR